MKIYLLRGNPIALLIVSVALSILSFIFLLMTFISKRVLPSEICLFIAFIILYSTGIQITFYWVAFHSSNKTSISPKKYKKAMQVYEKNEELIAFLNKNNQKYVDIKPERAIDVAIQIMSQNENAKI